MRRELVIRLVLLVSFEALAHLEGGRSLRTKCLDCVSLRPRSGAGGARAAEHLRSIGVELQMVSAHASVHIGGSDFMAVHPMFGNKPIDEIEANLLPSTKTALDELVWWAKLCDQLRCVFALVGEGCPAAPDGC